MIDSQATERLFAMPAFEALRVLRNYRTVHPEMATVELMGAIQRIEPDGQSLDLEASLHLDDIVDRDCDLGGATFYRSCIRAVVLNHQPIWAKSMSQGRTRFVSKLDTNDQSIFDAAGLLDDPPEMELVEWWDAVCGEARAITDRKKMMQARKAELMSIELERVELERQGINKTPKWTGLDDNFAGYDVLSYRFRNESIVSKLIEVKSTIASPIRFYLTRNEWNTAEQIGVAYVFHIWDMNVSPERLYVRSVQQVSKHIPTDQEDGKWTVAMIPLGRDED